MGLFHLVRMFGSAESHRVWLGISGLLLIVLGVVLLRHLNLTVALIGLIVGISWIIQGLSALAGGMAAGPARGTRLVDLLRDHQPDRRNRRRRGASGVGYRAGRPGRHLVHHPGPGRDHRRLHVPGGRSPSRRSRSSIRRRCWPGGAGAVAQPGHRRSRPAVSDAPP